MAARSIIMVHTLPFCNYIMISILSHVLHVNTDWTNLCFSLRDSSGLKQLGAGKSYSKRAENSKGVSNICIIINVQNCDCCVAGAGRGIDRKYSRFLNLKDCKITIISSRKAHIPKAFFQTTRG